ncbi:hypothetical protein DFH06DRAFT_1471451 [Mycena polygramma]|nr:hypothetical protein C8R47DRAFT_142649 [Mycena vitilis]KAJ7662665.1 hypothetical protein DFH06DRAFT_1471451 [Mycena polygramma]
MSDLMNKAKEALSGSGTSGNTGGGQMNTQGGAVGGQEDYADKGLDFIEKKEGMSESRATNEKITDAARSGYEKLTGNDVSSKISN